MAGFFISKNDYTMTCSTETFYFLFILFMSQILFQGNNLVVTGEIGQEYSNIPLTDSEKASKQNLRRTFHLTFIVQVNGKMIIHHEQIELYQIKEFVYEPEDWNAWYALCRIFNSF